MRAHMANIPASINPGTKPHKNNLPIEVPVAIP